MNTYIKRANLRGYRTIHDVDAEFNPGLNIIIGKNGSGKTNFMSFLKRAIDLDYKFTTSFFAKLEFSGTENYTVEAVSDLQNLKLEDDLSEVLMSQGIELTLTRNGKQSKFNNVKELRDKIKPLNSFNHVQLIVHGVNKDGFSDFVSTPLSFDVSLGSGFNAQDLIDNLWKKTTSFFNASLFRHIIVETFLDDEDDLGGMSREEYFETEVLAVFTRFCDKLNEEISTYLPIDSVRLNPSYKIYKDTQKNILHFEGFVLDYCYSGSWLPFSSLSDGTQRLFYLYAETIVGNIYTKVNFFDKVSNKIILLEEPELGIHPHQFHLIMNFLKEVATRNQVIITTHAPQALNILSQDELDSINICSFNADEGTTIKKLAPDQIEKAKKYMEEMYLSDYWVYSNLEER